MITCEYCNSTLKTEEIHKGKCPNCSAPIRIIIDGGVLENMSILGNMSIMDELRMQNLKVMEALKGTV